MSNPINYFLILIFIFLTISNDIFSQNLPTRGKDKKVIYTDLVVYDTLNRDTAFLRLSEFFQSDQTRFLDLVIDSSQRTIRCKYKTIAYINPPNHLGTKECDIYVKCLPNKIGYRVTNFKHILPNNGCENNIEVERPKCFDMSHYKYWKNIKRDFIGDMNDFILVMVYTPIRGSSSDIIKIDEYFLAKNRN